jgi:hypothetical protein
MAIAHPFISGKADGGDATLVQPSNWNATHTVDQDGFTIPEHATSPATPAADTATVFVRNLGGRPMLAQMGPSGLDTAFQPHWGRNRTVYWQPLGNATTVPLTTGLIASTNVGTLTTRTVALTNIATRMKRLGFVSVATAGGLAGPYWAAGAQQFAIGNGAGLGGFTNVWRFVVSDVATVTGARMFMGWRTVVTAPTNVEPSAITNCFGLAQLSTDATQWYIVYGGSAAQTAIPLGTGLGAPATNSTAWDLAFFAPPNSNNTVSYTVMNMGTGVTVTGTLTGTAGVALPLSTALLAPATYRTNNATLLAVGLDIASLYIETDQ